MKPGEEATAQIFAAAETDAAAAPLATAQLPKVAARAGYGFVSFFWLLAGSRPGGRLTFLCFAKEK